MSFSSPCAFVRKGAVGASTLLPLFVRIEMAAARGIRGKKRGVVNELPFPSPPLVCVTGSSSSSQGVVNKFPPILSFGDCRLEKFFL